MHFSALNLKTFVFDPGRQNIWDIICPLPGSDGIQNMLVGKEGHEHTWPFMEMKN